MSCKNDSENPRKALQKNGVTDIQPSQTRSDALAVIRLEIETLVQADAVPIVMPGITDLVEVRRYDLINAIEQAGGFDHVAGLLGYEKPMYQPIDETSKKQIRLNGQIEDDYIKYVLTKEAIALKHPGVMPSSGELIARNQLGVLCRIFRRGGMEKAMQDSGLTKQPRTQDYVNDPDRLKTDLLGFVKTHEEPGNMPIPEQLKYHNLISLARAIENIGVARVAHRCGLKYDDPNEPDYWEDFANLENEIQEVISEHGQPGMMPPLAVFEKNGRAYLLRPIHNFGGIRKVAKRMGLSCTWKHHR